MDTVFAVIKNIFLGFFGLIFVLFLLALVFGKRIIKQWEYEAEFFDENGREFGEFDIELSRIAKQETEDTFKASFTMRHERLLEGARIQIRLEDTVVLDGTVESNGRVRLGAEHIKTVLGKASLGQTCHVVIDGVECFSAQLAPD